MIYYLDVLDLIRSMPSKYQFCHNIAFHILFIRSIFWKVFDNNNDCEF